MDVMEAIRTRKSVRKYALREVEETVLRQVLEAGRLAPSASNRQEWRFVVVRSEETRRELAAAAQKQKFVAEAPVVIAACAVTDFHVMACGQLSYPIDVAIAIDHLTLAAVELGLGTCWIGAFDSDRVRDVLGIPANIPVVELLTLGYPADPTPKEKNRLSIEEIVRYEIWS